MISPEYEEFDSTNLTTEQMREELFGRSWEYAVSAHGISAFSRTYQRVNLALEGDDWRETVEDFPYVLQDVAPELPMGRRVWVSGNETEVAVRLRADADDANDVTRVYALDWYLRDCGFEEIDEAVLADWSVLKGEPGSPRIGSKAHYEQHPRSAELRTIGIELIASYTSVVRDEGMEGEAMARLLALNRRLAQLAIEPGMHVGAPMVEFVDSVKRAEFVAGSLRSILLEGWGFAGNAGAVLAEHDMLAGEGGELRMIDMRSSSPAPSAARLLMTLGSLAEMLDAAADKSDD